jgi:hypothetical protein
MKRFNSTIVQKKCKCSEDCDKYPTMGYRGYYIHHFPGEKSNKNITSRASNNIESKMKKEVRKKTKSDYLKIADLLFSAFIKKRDSDSSGNIKCISCNRTYNLKDKNSDGSYIVQAMHFVPRGTYSLRFDERNVHAGCCYCNLDMHLHSDGHAYKRYRNYLLNTIGKEDLEEMELSKKEINKITDSYLKEIINKYK